MRQIKSEPMHRNRERGIVILLVAVVLLFVVGAMAALSIDVVTFYTARSEAQLAADSAALAGARVLANSGMTSYPANLTLATNAQNLATQIAQQVATQNQVGGTPLNLSEVTFPNIASTAVGTNPRITVQVKRTNLPTFFARIWGKATVTVQASATAEVYNPSGANALTGTVPVAPTCVKPWVLPNMSPNGGPLIDRLTGAIMDTTLVGENLSGPSPPWTPFRALCGGTCGSGGWTAPTVWQYYPGDLSSFPAPTGALPACAATLNPYQQSVAGCVQTPIACGQTVNLDNSSYSGRNFQTYTAVNCLTSATANEADTIDPASVPPTQPFQFLAGDDNPLVLAGALSARTHVMVSNSIVTVPIYDDGNLSQPPSSTVQLVGFVQLFLNSDGNAAPSGTPSGILTTVINIAGCGTGASGQPILGNGASPVPVRLITPP